jgi:FAD-dependent urate hydroxylase
VQQPALRRYGEALKRAFPESDDCQESKVVVLRTLLGAEPQMETCDVAIVGAGPFGLSAAAYLREIKGLEIRIFGQPMGFWERCMPPAMLLRSGWHATHIADPKNEWTLDTYASRNGDGGFGEPIPVSRFIQYGQWFHDQLGIAADTRKVVRISRKAGRFELLVNDFASLRARRVLLATGIESYAHEPDIFRRLPAHFVSHSSELTNFNTLRDKEVVVIGGGQSALESAAFLYQAGARVRILVRAPGACPRPRFALLKQLIDPKRLKFLYGRGGVGSAGISLIIQQPHLYARLSARRRAVWDRKSTKLGFSYRLVPHMNGTQVLYGQSVDRVEVRGDRAHLRLSDGTQLAAEHIVLGTGYRVDVSKCRLFAPAILDQLRLADGYPILDAGLESSVPGLHFLGAPAAYSFGPLLRFVAGTQFAASAVARKIRRAKNKVG